MGWELQHLDLDVIIYNYMLFRLSIIKIFHKFKCLNLFAYDQSEHMAKWYTITCSLVDNFYIAICQSTASSKIVIRVL